MSNDPSSSEERQPPSQSSQMDAFRFQTTEYHPPQGMRKNYVFVDEHNRHKRLKVMRACEGCRRRKIKCDAATTNSWPCSACIRLKLHCVRPNGPYEDPGPEPPPVNFRSATLPGLQGGYGPQMPLDAQGAMSSQPKTNASMYMPPGAYADSAAMLQAGQYLDPAAGQHSLNYTTMPPAMGVVDQYSAQNVFPTPPMRQSSRADSPTDLYPQDQPSDQLADLLGSLKMNEAGTAPYLNSKMYVQREGQDAGDDFEANLPPLVSGPGSRVRIPPELMPDDETVLHYFDLYFSTVHPYVPVINKTTFLQQWQTNRESISPLLLEAIFAIAGRLANDGAEGQQWLAMASRHADAFMYMPRLSTLQALIILLKARESAPKKDYYFRSWMTVVQCVQMGKELGLDEHFSDHQAGRHCERTHAECHEMTRMWQTMFVCEVMIGSPQGRTDLAVDLDSVDFSVPRPYPGSESGEDLVSRNFTYFARVVRNVSKMNRVYGRIRKMKDWGIDPEFVQLNPLLNAWLGDLPVDLQVSYPADGSPPWLHSSFLGNLHSYHYLSVILLHKPQLSFLNPMGADGQWKHHMLLCCSAAKFLCRLQESILQTYGLTGLQSMQRGINFTIYCALTSIGLYLVAMTSPDADLRSDTSEYFTRQMRILESCMSAWPMADMQRQIESFREAFSADVRKPFVLKPSFPYGSPSTTSSSPPRLNTSYSPSLVRSRSLEQQLDSSQGGGTPHSQVGYTGHPLSPISAGPADIKGEVPGVQQSMVMLSSSTGQVSQPPALAATSMPLSDAAQGWNPNRLFEYVEEALAGPFVLTQTPGPSVFAPFHGTSVLFPLYGPSAFSPPPADFATSMANVTSHHSQWNSTFGTPPAQPQQQQHQQHQQQQQQRPPVAVAAPPNQHSGAPEMSAMRDQLHAANAAGLAPGLAPEQQMATQPYPTAPVQAFVTPAMWQQSVASVYEGGMKRQWAFDNTTMADAMGKR